MHVGHADLIREAIDGPVGEDRHHSRRHDRDWAVGRG